jgi:DNA polymerase elongation subunit (family B)
MESAPQRNRVVIDIETIGYAWDGLSDQERAYLTERADGDADAARDALALSALTGEVVVIGMFNPDSGRGKLVVRRPPDAVPSPGSPEYPEVTAALDGRGFSVALCDDEPSLLRMFWEDVAKFAQLITFNGRSFDGPFLMQRSVIREVPITRELVPQRYANYLHLDLLDRLTCYGATKRASLDFWCRRLGFPSPKESGNGKDVERLWRGGQLLDLCTYNAADLRSTAQLLARYDAVFPKGLR